MQSFYSNGKLLLTAEYVVLDGANALALPTKYGQTLSIEPINEPKIYWQSLNEKGDIWFEDLFKISNNKISSINSNNNAVSKRLIEILLAAQTLNSLFLNCKNGFRVTSKLDFPENWGLGSSSTLLNNIAQWAKVDAFALSNATFGGSGYDIACAQNDWAIIYFLKNKMPQVKKILFKKPFEDKLFFVHLNRKQNSRDAIKTYQQHKNNSADIIFEINKITSKITTIETLADFENLIKTHETLIGKITNQTPIKQRLFPDYKNQIKSLGGWNGDFVLATGNKDYVYTYFKDKGYTTIVDYVDMIL